MSRPSERLMVAIAALAVIGAYAWLSRYGVDLIDEGYFLDLAGRVRDGLLPYRDFDTYYTPGMFYLEAGALAALGNTVLTTRALMLAMRVLCGLLVYRLARRVAPPAFAAVPALLLAVTGVLIGSSPGWPALLSTLLMLEALAQHDHMAERASMLGLAGAAAGLAFAFKQNVGAFALLAVLGYVVLRQRPKAGGAVVAIRVSYACCVAWSTRTLLSPALDEWLGVAVWLPFVLTFGLLTWASARGRAPLLAGLGGLARDGAWVGGGFGLVTLLWLVPLVAALGLNATPISLFLGSVKQAALAFRLEAPPRAAASVALVAVWAPLVLALACGPARSRLVWPLGVAAQASLVVAWLPTPSPRSEELARLAAPFPRLEALELELGSLYLYLPAVAAWTALVLLAPLVRRRAMPPLVGWYLMAGTLAELALYPRADASHAVVAGAPLLIVGAWVLARIHDVLTRDAARPAQAAAFAALLVVPTAAILPRAYETYLRLAHPDPAIAAPAEYVPLGLERAPILMPRVEAEALRGAIGYIQDRTGAGEPVFAYPVDPLVNFLADRPNPTRFDHLMPGALTAEEMAEVVADLEAAQPKYVFWDHGGVVFWNTDKPNRRLSDYIWRCYKQVATFHLYLVLERTADCQTGTSPP